MPTEETKVTNDEAQETKETQQSPNIKVTTMDGTTRAEVEDNKVNPLADESQQEEKAPEKEGDEKPADEKVQEEWSKQQEEEKSIADDLSKKGVNFDDLAKEYEDTGKLSDKSMEALDKAGYPKAVVDAYLDGLEAKISHFTDTVKSFAGGEKEFEQLKTYMQTQPKSMIDGFNSAIQSGNLSQIKLTIEGIKAEMTNKYGTANPTIMGNGNVGGAVSGYTNMSQMTKDMSDPRYQVDPVFTKQVYAKIQNSTIF